jgi:hypothetical protein
MYFYFGTLGKAKNDNKGRPLLEKKEKELNLFFA